VLEEFPAYCVAAFSIVLLALAATEGSG